LILPLIVSAIDGPTSDTKGNFPLVKISSESFARYRALCSVSYTPQNSRLLSQETPVSCVEDIRYR
jgi:hypothetical protein